MNFFVMFGVTFGLCMVVAIPWFLYVVWGARGVVALVIGMLLLSAAVWIAMPHEAMPVPGMGSLGLGALFTCGSLILLTLLFAASKLGAFRRE